jgi:hypothetical protein
MTAMQLATLLLAAATGLLLAHGIAWKAVQRAKANPASFRLRPWVLMGIVGLIFLVLLGGLLHGKQLDAADAGINALFGTYRSEPLVTAFLWVTALGANPATTAVAATATAFLWSARRLIPVGALWVTFLGAQATTWTIKFLTGRVRPEFLEGISANSPSFPSGHATSAMAVYGFLAYLVARQEATPRRSFEVLFWAAVLIVFIGFSRIFLSLHCARRRRTSSQAAPGKS